MLNLKNRSIAAVAAIAATIVTVGGVAAPARAEGNAVAVHYADLDLSTKAGASMLDRRIVRAAYLACGYADAGNRIEVARCRQTAVTAARADALQARRSVVLASR